MATACCAVGDRGAQIAEIGVTAQAFGRIEQRVGIGGSAALQARTGFADEPGTNVAHHLHRRRVAHVEQAKLLGVRSRGIIRRLNQIAAREAILGRLGEARDVFVACAAASARRR